MGIFEVIVILIAAAWVIGIIWATRTGKELEMVKRSAIWGSLITGFIGWLFAINSMLGGEEIGAGICCLHRLWPLVFLPFWLLATILNEGFSIYFSLTYSYEIRRKIETNMRIFC